MGESETGGERGKKRRKDRQEIVRQIGKSERH